MVERRRGARLSDESELWRPGSALRCGEQKLQGDLTSEPLVPRLVDDAHAAGADRILHRGIARSGVRTTRSRDLVSRRCWLQSGAS